MKTTEEFLEEIKDGKWFLVKGTYNHLVKMKVFNYGEKIGTVITTLWLSLDHESMCFSEYFDNDWKFEDEIFKTNSASVYLFGDTTPHEDSIYDEDGNLNEDKMFKEILSSQPENFITEEELKKAWNDVKSNKYVEYPEIKFED